MDEQLVVVPEAEGGARHGTGGDPERDRLVFGRPCLEDDGREVRVHPRRQVVALRDEARVPEPRDLGGHLLRAPRSPPPAPRDGVKDVAGERGGLEIGEDAGKRADERLGVAPGVRGDGVAVRRTRVHRADRPLERRHQLPRLRQ